MLVRLASFAGGRSTRPGAADLAFPVATQSELDALSAPGTINAAGNPVQWTKLKGVPAGFADGVDNSITSWNQLNGLPCTRRVPMRNSVG